MPLLSLIAVVGRDLGIGREQRLLWNLPEDLRHFRALTLGKAVLMGRKTWESLPRTFRPLPGRRNIVLSRNPSYVADGAVVVGSIGEALRLTADAADLLVIGGADLYEQTIGVAQRLYLTEVHERSAADRFFPKISGAVWREVSRRPGGGQEVDGRPQGPDFDFVVYERLSPDEPATTEILT